MPGAVIHDLLIAEAEAFPFASLAAFEGAVTALSMDRNAPGVLTRGTAALATALEERLRPYAGGLALQALTHLRDAAWFTREDDGPTLTYDVPLAAHLTRVAAYYLEDGTGNRYTLRGDEGFSTRAARFRWLSFLLPPDLLVAAIAARSRRDPSDDNVTLVSPQLLQILERPTADTHLHGGAAFSFSLLWTHLMAFLSSQTPSASSLKGDGTPPFRSGDAFLRALLSAAIARVLLAAFLWRRDLGARDSLEQFLDGALGDIARRASWVHGPTAARAEYLHILRSLWAGRVTDRSTPLLAALYRGLVGPRIKAATSVSSAIAADPLSAWLSTAGATSTPTPETRFARRALDYLLHTRGRDDVLFARAFWQYERIRCLTFRHLTQEPGVSGLDWFSRHFQRIRALRGKLAAVLTESALHLQSQDVRLAALEVRTSPARSWSDLRRDIKAIANQADAFDPRPGDGRPEIGLVLHFLKERTSTETRCLHGDPRDLVFGCRFGRWFHQRNRERMAICELLRHRPASLVVLRGIDVASVELSVPTWPTVPLILAVRQASAEAAGKLLREQPRWRVPAMRVTYHVGEDYRRLSEGLRRIHELIAFGVLRVGDRIGHGLALGDTPERWARAARRVSQPAEERLDDLLWELERYGAGDFAPEVSRVEFVRHQACLLARAIYRDAFTDVHHLAEARRRRHEPTHLTRLGFPCMRMHPAVLRDQADRLLWLYLRDEGVFDRGQKPIEVDATDGEVAMLKEAQRWLRRRVVRMEITVESNPSSNLLIGSYLDIQEHPAFRLQPLPGAVAAEGGPVLLSVNVDDPITFSSRLADEYAHLYFTLLRSGVTSQDALAWLDRLRENGYRSRFTLPLSTDREVLRGIARSAASLLPDKSGDLAAERSPSGPTRC